jgi:hypothetical protein
MNPEDVQKFIKNNGKQKYINQMKQMIQEGKITDINVTTSIEGYHSVTDGMTALIYQSGNGKIGAMMWILEQMKIQGKLDEGINIQDSNGYTALLMAVYFGDPDKVKLLLDYGADRTIEDPLGAAQDQLIKNKDYQDIKTKYELVINLLNTYFPIDEQKNIEIEQKKILEQNRLYEQKNKKIEKRSYLSWRNARLENAPSPPFGSQVIRAPTIQKSIKKGGKRRKTRKTKNRRKTRKF